jgi:hypothetical protein
MTRQRTPWQTHGAYMATQICDGKNPMWKLFVTVNFVTGYRAQPGPEWFKWTSRGSVKVKIRHIWLAVNL